MYYFIETCSNIRTEYYYNRIAYIYNRYNRYI